MKSALPYCILFFIGLVSAFVSKQVQSGSFPIWAPIGTSILSGVVWGWVASYSHNLSVTSVLVNVIYTFSFILGFYILGDRLSAMQITGLLVALAGIIMMNY